MSDHTYRGTEIVGTSPDGVDAAIRSGIERASKTLRHIDWFDVVSVGGHLQADSISHFQVTLKVGFRLEDDHWPKRSRTRCNAVVAAKVTHSPVGYGFATKKWKTTTIIDHADAYPVDAVNRHWGLRGAEPGLGRRDRCCNPLEAPFRCQVR